MHYPVYNVWQPYHRLVCRLNHRPNHPRKRPYDRRNTMMDYTIMYAEVDGQVGWYVFYGDEVVSGPFPFRADAEEERLELVGK